jgi:hypothetical protein
LTNGSVSIIVWLLAGNVFNIYIYYEFSLLHIFSLVIILGIVINTGRHGCYLYILNGTCKNNPQKVASVGASKVLRYYLFKVHFVLYLLL